jgi:hypothetical protein
MLDFGCWILDEILSGSGVRFYVIGVGCITSSIFYAS